MGKSSLQCNGYILFYDHNAKISGGLSWTNRAAKDVLLILSSHVETVALLTRKKDVERIDIEMTVDREDVTEKATYQKIQEYVKEKYGLNVHTKYIAEVKRKHGLPMHEAPNKVDVPKREYPACPVEKVKAIEEALKYFRLLY